MSNPDSNMPVLENTPATSGSSTITQTATPPQPALRLAATSGTLRLRAEPAERRHIQWAEDVVDNEGLGRKSSKVCCIFHKAREVGESSDESSSDSSSDDDSDSEPDNSTARPVGGSKRGGKRGRRPHQHDHDHKNGDDCGNNGSAQGQPRRKPSPNAYEKMPKPKK